MNITKGLFRLWVVVALCWSFTGAWSEYDDLTSVHDVRLAGNPPPCKPDAGVVWDQCKPWERDWSKTEFVSLPKNIYFRRWQLLVFTRPAGLERRVAAVRWILLPRTFLLLFGLMGVWVLKGFRGT